MLRCLGEDGLFAAMQNNLASYDAKIARFWHYFYAPVDPTYIAFLRAYTTRENFMRASNVLGQNGLVVKVIFSQEMEGKTLRIDSLEYDVYESLNQYLMKYIPNMADLQFFIRYNTINRYDLVKYLNFVEKYLSFNNINLPNKYIFLNDELIRQFIQHQDSLAENKAFSENEWSKYFSFYPLKDVIHDEGKNTITEESATNTV